MMMHILSTRRSFDADHSSSSYEFFAYNPLSKEQREAVRTLTGKSARRHLQFQYMGEWSDIPGDWPDRLLTLGYDVLISESYDWWAAYLSLPHDPDLLERLETYQIKYGACGFDVRVVDGRMILYFGMQLDYGMAYNVLGKDAFAGLADLFQTARDELLAGDLSVVWALFRRYGYDDPEEGPPPVEPLSDAGDTLLKVITIY